MAPVKSFLVAAFCAALVCASVGARELQTTFTPCVSYMGGTVSSTSGVAFTSTFTQAFKSCLKTFCDTTPCSETCADPDIVPTDPVVAEAIAEAAPALATACTKAMTQVMSKGFIAGDCSGFYSSVKAYAKAQTMARAVSTSFASAYASVVGEQAYSAVAANISVITTALQSKCLKEFTEINPSTTKCSKTDTKCTKYNIPGGLSRWNSLSEAQQNNCWIVTCCFANPTESEIETTATTSAQAIANATALVTITQTEGACTYDGQVRTCREFTKLCDAVCVNGLECRDPIAVDTCSPDQGDWAELPNHDWQCQPVCEDPEQVVHAVCNIVPCDKATGCLGEECQWECVTPPEPTCPIGSGGTCDLLNWKRGCSLDTSLGYYDSACDTTTEGDLVCVDTRESCSKMPPCTSSSDCASDRVCVANSCCAHDVCILTT